MRSHRSSFRSAGELGTGMSLLAPPSLRSGDTIAIVPSARAISIEELQDGILLAESWGLRVKLGQGIGRKIFQQAGSDEERAADLQTAIKDPEVRAIWCARGGYGTVRLLDHLDLEPLKKDPKWIVGFSDGTVLHNALHNLGIRSLHAQMPFNLSGKTNACKESLREALFGIPKTIEYSIGSNEDTTSLHRNGKADGVLIGGNISVLHSLRGTPYDLDPKGKILFLEDLDELLYHMDRMIQNLRLGNWFDQLAGLVVGGLSDMRNKNENDPFGLTAEEIISHAMGNFDPVCFNFPAGHIDDNRALVLGAKVRLEVATDSVKLSYPEDPIGI